MTLAALNNLPKLLLYPTNEQKSLCWKVTKIATFVASFLFGSFVATPILKTLFQASPLLGGALYGTYAILQFILQRYFTTYCQDYIEFYQDEAGVDSLEAQPSYQHTPREQIREAYYSEQLRKLSDAIKGKEQTEPLDQKALYELRKTQARTKLKMLYAASENSSLKPISYVVDFASNSSYRAGDIYQKRFVRVGSQFLSINDIMDDRKTNGIKEEIKKTLANPTSPSEARRLWATPDPAC